ncbi:MAG: DUF6600 domain-containing protein [Syntrophobacteraceae bacterium]
MKYVGKIVLLAVIALCSAAQAAWSGPQPPDQPRRQTPSKESVLVGRISFVEGELLRYVHEAKDWVVTGKDTPFGREDALYLGENGKAEFLMPNDTWIRIGANTQIQMVALKDDATEVDVAIGIARFINRSQRAVIKATTPFGYAVGAPGSVFDLYVGDESVEVVAIKGKVEFIHDLDGAKYNVIAGSISILADNRQAVAGEGKVDAAWDDWNISRDAILAHGIETKGESVKHLPEGIREDSRVLDENGRWESVYYRGEYREVWRPTSVEEGWAPYTVGHWTDWYGDYTWVPYEPFGYVTHHYGYWFQANDYWYWTPPSVSVGWGVPYWGIGFGWYPGRVGWLYSGDAIGWFPLLPWEPFYAFNWWGPWGFTVYHAGLINIDFHRFRYWDRSVVVKQSDFHGVNSYARTRLTNVDRGTIASQFKAAPVVNNHVLKTAGDPEQRFNYSNATPHSKPAQNVTSRVAENQAKFRMNAPNVSGSAIRNQVSSAKLAKPAIGASRVSVPQIASERAGVVRQQALKQNPRVVKPASAREAKSGHGPAGQQRSGHGRGTNARSGAAGKVSSQRPHGSGSRAAANGQRANGRRNTLGQGTYQNRNLLQGRGQQSSGSPSGARRGTGGQPGGALRRGGPQGGRPSGFRNSPAGMSGARGLGSGAGGRPGGGVHAGSGHR